MANQKPTDNPNAQTETPATPPAGMVNMADFASMIGGAVATAIDARDSKTRKVTFGEYQRRINAGRSTLRRETFQNGFRLEEVQLSNAEIDLLNRISRTGRYIDRKVEVIVREDGADEVVEIRYNNKTRDQMFELRNHFRDFADLLTQIVMKQDEENEEQEQREGRKRSEPSRRPFGDTKASREARAAAGA